MSEKNYWLHRISHHENISYPLIEEGYMTTGWSHFSKKGFIESIKEKDSGWINFEEELAEWGNPRNRYNLWRFVVEMKKGDWVIVPGYKVFSIYEIIDEGAFLISEVDATNLRDWNGNKVSFGADNKLYDENNYEIDLGFVRQVKPIELNIPRYEYTDNDLTTRLKYRQTNADISDLSRSINLALESFKHNKPINAYSLITKRASCEILKTIKEILDPDKLELLVKWFFKRIGAGSVNIPSKNAKDKEGDADIIATFEQIKTIIYVQVKAHGGQTNDWAIQQIKDYKSQQDILEDGYSKIAWVISTCDNFSEEAQKLATESNIQLINGDTFSNMILEAGILNLDEAFNK